MVTRPHFGMFHKDMHFWLLLPITRAPRCIINIKKPFKKQKKIKYIKENYTFVHKSKLLLWQAAEPSSSGFCHVEEFTYLSVAKNKQENPTIDMAKILIKSEKLTPFGGIFSDHTAYCLKSHCGIRGH